MELIDLSKLTELAEKATPGPRRWEINLQHKSVTLNGGNPNSGFGRYDLDILQFCRWGMNSATVRFRNERDIMQNAEDFARIVEGREHHASWFQTLDQPDANFIASLDPSTVLALVRIARVAQDVARFDQYSLSNANHIAVHAQAMEALRESLKCFSS